VSAEVEANLVEVFSSIQGEGPHVGTPTLFVRFGRCDLRCGWCDSPHTWLPAEQCRFERVRGEGAFESAPNPISLSQLLEAAEALELERHAFVSLTGGEQLLQPHAVRAIAEALRSRGPRIHLETHGLATEALESVIDALDVVSMDWKLASDVRRETDPRHGAVDPFHVAHEAFLQVARRAPEVVVKLVVTCDSTDAEIQTMAEAVARVDPATPVVVQPVTPSGPVRESPHADRLLAIVFELSRTLASVRLIPQTHKLYGAL
jgi:organic radical activating enzyme